MVSLVLDWLLWFFYPSETLEDTEGLNGLISTKTVTESVTAAAPSSIPQSFSFLFFLGAAFADVCTTSPFLCLLHHTVLGAVQLVKQDLARVHRLQDRHLGEVHPLRHGLRVGLEGERLPDRIQKREREREKGERGDIQFLLSRVRKHVFSRAITDHTMNQ